MFHCSLPISLAASSSSFGSRRFLASPRHRPVRNRPCTPRRLRFNCITLRLKPIVSAHPLVCCKTFSFVLTRRIALWQDSVAQARPLLFFTTPPSRLDRSFFARHPRRHSLQPFAFTSPIRSHLCYSPPRTKYSLRRWIVLNKVDRARHKSANSFV